MGCRVDLCRAHRARCSDRPVDLYHAAGRLPSRQALRDEDLTVEIARVHASNYGVYGARKVWLALNRDGIDVARCSVERLMKKLGLRGVRRGKQCKTTCADPAAARPTDLVNRHFAPRAPNQLSVADFTYVPTWSGMVYVAFVIDAYARRILGWRAATTMTTTLVLDALDQAVWTRNRDGIKDLAGLIHHNDAGSQYLDRLHRPAHRSPAREASRRRSDASRSALASPSAVTTSSMQSGSSGEPRCPQLGGHSSTASTNSGNAATMSSGETWASPKDTGARLAIRIASHLS